MNKNKTQKIILSLVGVMLVLITVMAAQAAIKSGGKLDVSLVSQEPDPVDPGEIIDVRFRIENTGFSELEEITFEIVEEYPFSVYSGDNQQTIMSLEALQEESSGVILLYEIKVDEEAVQGTNSIDVRYKIGDGKWVVIEDFPIRIRTRDLVLSLESIKSTPESISPGKEFELSFTLKNNADSLIRDVTVNLDVSGSSTPIAPSTSLAEKQIYQINSQTGKIMKFDMIALPDAEGGIYKIPVNISYTDETGTSYSKDDYISLKISATPDLLLTVDSSEIKGDQKSGNVILRITNRGLTNIKLLTAKLSESDDYTILSEPEVYVGNIDSDDYETVEYTLVMKSFEKTVEIPLEIDYMDATNKKYKQDVSIELKTFSSSLPVIIIKGIVSLIIRLAILGAIIYFGYRFYKKRKNKKRQG